MFGVAAAAGLALAQPAAETPVRLTEFIVGPSRFGVAEERVAVGAMLTSDEIEKLPQLGDDLYRSISRLPGLAADDFTAQFWVRGAPHDELLARLDGVDLIEPLHLKDVDGALSIVDPQILGRLDLVTGGFTAEFGDRLAAVLTMETKRATRTRTALGLSLTGVSAMNQGATRGGRGNWLVAARRGYPDIGLRMAGRDDEVYPRYYDVTAKFEYRLAPTHTVSVHGLRAGDTLRYQRNETTLRSSYDSEYFWVRWRGAIGDRVNGETVLSRARLTWNRDGGTRVDGRRFVVTDHRALDVLALRSDWDLTLGERALARAGFEAKRHDARYDYESRWLPGTPGGVDNTIHPVVHGPMKAETVAGFGAVRFRPVAPLVLESGVRFDQRYRPSADALSPRFNAALALGRSTLRAAWGRYTQAQGLHELEVAHFDSIARGFERAEHRIVGLEHPLPAGMGLRLEVYERRTADLRRRWENVDNGYELLPEAQSDRTSFQPDRGRARGVELLVSGRRHATISWNAGYAWSRAEERVTGRWVPRARDQRHTVRADFTYAPNRRWDFSVAWQYHTGWPTTDVVYSLVPRVGLVSAYGPVYGLRLPAYHRLDLRATRRFALRWGELRVFVDVFNAYDRTNIIGYNHSARVSGTQVTHTRKPREQLPLLPSVGLTWEF